MARHRRGRHLLAIACCLLTMAVVPGCSHRDGVRDAREELQRRQVSFDLEGLRQATGRRDSDGAWLFEEAGFFAGLDDDAYLALLQHGARTGNYGLYRALARHAPGATFPPAALAEALDQAMRKRSAGMARLLLRHGARPGANALMQAAYIDDEALTRQLLEMGASPEAGENADAFRIAAGLGHLQVVRAFVGYPGTPDEQIGKAILRAALWERIDVVKYLVDHGADINQQDRDGCTPLHSLAQDGTVEMVRYMVEHGARINQPCRGSQTPLKWAHYGDNADVIDYLVANGATQ